jgi:hypothetical protein
LAPHSRMTSRVVPSSLGEHPRRPNDMLKTDL